MRQRILITISDGEVSKSILRSDVFVQLKARADLILLVHPHKVAHFTERFKSSHVRIASVPKMRFPILEEFWSDLFLYSLHTESIRVKIEHSYRAGGSIIAKFIKLILWRLGRFHLYRSVCRRVYSLFRDAATEAVLDDLQPNLIFAANLTASEDARLLRAAKKRKIPSVGMPKGWDNLTLKTFLPVFPDVLLVQTDLMKNDAVALDVPVDSIRVVGFPKFDVYAGQARMSRREFMDRLGFDTDRPLILYAGAGDQLAPHDEDILANLIAAIAAGEFSPQPQVLVRPHPKYAYRTDLLPPQPFWKLDLPGSRLTGDFEFDAEDIAHLRDSLEYADVLVHTASTLGIEAAIFDTPSITLAFDGHARVHRGLSVARYNQYDHMRRALATGGMRVASSFGALTELIKKYLAEPGLDREQRAVMVTQNAHVIDGGAGRRVAETILAELE